MLLAVSVAGTIGLALYAMLPAFLRLFGPTPETNPINAPPLRTFVGFLLVGIGAPSVEWSSGGRYSAAFTKMVGAIFGIIAGVILGRGSNFPAVGPLEFLRMLVTGEITGSHTLLYMVVIGGIAGFISAHAYVCHQLMQIGQRIVIVALPCFAVAMANLCLIVPRSYEEKTNAIPPAVAIGVVLGILLGHVSRRRIPALVNQ